MFLVGASPRLVSYTKKKSAQFEQNRSRVQWVKVLVETDNDFEKFLIFRRHGANFH